jgi:geranylgeranyl diphosphate synthase type II
MISAALAKELEEYLKVIDSAIGEAIDSYPWGVPKLKEAVRYSLEGGKRLRSIILLSVYDELSSASEASEPVVGQSGLPDPSNLSRPPGYWNGPMAFAVALEMIQAYSLVHDDLPCMDDDDYRRGRLSCHKKFGEATALLCGDALLTMAFECMVSCKGIPHEQVLRAALAIARAAGPSGMVGGQLLDLLFEGQTEVPGIPDMYRMKTGALFRCSAMAGAILAGASTNVVELCGTWGELFGYAYQIIDDIEDSGAGGKEQDKNTLLKTMSLSEACMEAKQSLTKSIEAASAVFPGQVLIKELSGIYLSRLEDLEHSEGLEHSNSNDGRR